MISLCKPSKNRKEDNGGGLRDVTGCQLKCQIKRSNSLNRRSRSQNMSSQWRNTREVNPGRGGLGSVYGESRKLLKSEIHHIASACTAFVLHNHVLFHLLPCQALGEENNWARDAVFPTSCQALRRKFKKLGNLFLLRVRWQIKSRWLSSNLISESLFSLDTTRHCLGIKNLTAVIAFSHKDHGSPPKTYEKPESAAFPKFLTNFSQIVSNPLNHIRVFKFKFRNV